MTEPSLDHFRVLTLDGQERDVRVPHGRLPGTMGAQRYDDYVAAVLIGNRSGTVSGSSEGGKTDD